MKSIILFASFVITITCISCKKENPNSKVVRTVVKGHVEDPTRGISISGYKVVLVRNAGTSCATFVCVTSWETIAETYTDINGNYSITFDYKVVPGLDYYLEEQYYGIPYYHESVSGSGPIVGGATNIINMTAWKPVELKLNVQVLNNNKPPLMIRNELATTHQTYLNTENIYQQNTNGTYILKSRPNSDINIIFYYNVDYSSPTHQKIIPYHTTLDSTVTLNYMIDCSTF